MTNEPAIDKDAARKLRKLSRSGARLAAVQALYQIEQTGRAGRAVIEDYCEDGIGLDDEGRPIEAADPEIFRNTVEGVIESLDDINLAIVKRLADGWKIERLDATSRAILRAGVYELMKRDDLPAQIILDEYVSIAHAFFDDAEPRFINALLENVREDVRDKPA
ncbi:transcription antitermination factor NusB [Hirschia baltica]|uniref:Transcription antitermination protein NusB n=1 Tax=Hirschia baltica (strain ATCC 49814 / DSM 5838 / IFAM 1418) TaxID=582402 RepID=C6XIX5_HIRBI|nr:transcription antitermination factor NusB [Hirschia baltica]ACT59070.1 NusB antitermination factor [Hirschia baltica ATCC 49814]